MAGSVAGEGVIPKVRTRSRSRGIKTSAVQAARSSALENVEDRGENAAVVVLDRLPTCDAVLPGFTADGVLPEGDYEPTRADFEGHFVTSAARNTIYDGWNRHRNALLSLGLSGATRELLDGSFTEAKVEPGDMDLVVAIETNSGDLADLGTSPILKLLRGPETKNEFMCDAYVLFVLPEDDPNYRTVTLTYIRYWTRWFGTTRRNTTKGRVWATAGGLR